jgi:hypothetical protein
MDTLADNIGMFVAGAVVLAAAAYLLYRIRAGKKK